MADINSYEFRRVNNALDTLLNTLNRQVSNNQSNESSTETTINTWTSYIGLFWKVAIIIALGAIGWRDLTTDISIIRSEIIVYESKSRESISDLKTKHSDDILEINTALSNGLKGVSVDFDKEYKSLQKDVKYADSTIEGKIDVIKNDTFNMIASAKKDIIEESRITTNSLSSKLVDNSVAVTQLSNLINNHISRADAELKAIPISMTTNTNILNEKISNTEDLLSEKINDIIKERIQSKVEYSILTAELHKLMAKVEDMEKCMYRSKETKK